MGRRGRCRCGSVLTFRKRQQYKQLCSHCGSVVRLRPSGQSNDKVRMAGKAFTQTENAGGESTLFDEPMQAPAEPEVELVVVDELPSQSLSISCLLRSPSVIAAFVLALVIVAGVIFWCLR